MSFWLVIPAVLIVGVVIGIALVFWLDGQAGPKF